MHDLASKKKIQLRDIDCIALVSVPLSSIRLLIIIILLSSLATEFRAPSGSSNAHYLRSCQEIGEIFLSNDKDACAARYKIYETIPFNNKCSKIYQDSSEMNTRENEPHEFSRGKI